MIYFLHITKYVKGILNLDMVHLQKKEKIFQTIVSIFLFHIYALDISFSVCGHVDPKRDTVAMRICKQIGS